MYSNEDTDWASSLKGNYWKRVSGKVLVVGQKDKWVSNSQAVCTCGGKCAVDCEVAHTGNVTAHIQVTYNACTASSFKTTS